KLLNNNKIILENYLTVLSNRFVTVTDKMKTLNLKKLEGKIANYFLQMHKTQKSHKLKLAHTHQQLADYFGVARPSLSRIIGSFTKQKILKVDRKNVEIIDIEALQKVLK
ncbi:MAG: winged helix-turn-helix domain-containing protein, partial [Bacteroidales bacterium]|nr:winged helix-turn-helix domain-containing protein [Bacteroidales bacterium]